MAFPKKSWIKYKYHKKTLLWEKTHSTPHKDSKNPADLGSTEEWIFSKGGLSNKSFWNNEFLDKYISTKPEICGRTGTPILPGSALTGNVQILLHCEQTIKKTNWIQNCEVFKYDVKVRIDQSILKLIITECTIL